jgi:hypothetical protein
MRTVAVVMIVLGIIITGFNITSQAIFTESGMIEINKANLAAVNMSPFTGSILIVVGMALFVVVDKKSFT